MNRKFLADILHNAGVAIEVMTPLFPGMFLPMASVANIAKGIGGLAVGASRAVCVLADHLVSPSTLWQV